MRKEDSTITKFAKVSSVLATLFSPENCLVCNKRRDRSSLDNNICRTCWNGLPLKTGGICTVCGISLVSESTVGWKDYKCGDCRQKKRIPYNRIRSLLYYQEPVDKMIHLFKFEGMISVGEKLAGFLAKSMRYDEHYTHDVDLIVPVPLHIMRKLERGFNQAAVIADVIGAELSKPVVKGKLVRTRNTSPQSLLQGEVRRKNLKNAFVVKDNSFKNKHVLLVDDVVTTGTTIKECARVLKRSGASKISVITLCRTEKK